MDDAIKVELENGPLWREFHDVTNEMIVTKSGRRMFPFIRIRISNLNPDSIYSIQLDFQQANNLKCKFVNGGWTLAAPPSKNSTSKNPDRYYDDEDLLPAADESNSYTHPDSPNFGKFWTKEVVSFGRVKLNNKHQCAGQIFLESLRQYTPSVTIFRIGEKGEEISSIAKFQLPLTTFIAVTAYQNEAITALKIKHNPFAKAFQENKSRTDKDEYPEPDSSTIRNSHSDWSISADDSAPIGLMGEEKNQTSFHPDLYRHFQWTRFKDSTCIPYADTFFPSPNLYNHYYQRYITTGPLNTDGNNNNVVARNHSNHGNHSSHGNHGNASNDGAINCLADRPRPNSNHAQYRSALGYNHVTHRLNDVIAGADYAAGSAMAYKQRPSLYPCSLAGQLGHDYFGFSDSC